MNLPLPNAEPSVTQPAAPGRRRPQPRTVEVRSVERLTPRMVSVVFGGDGLQGFPAPAPTSHVKVFLPAPGQDSPTLPEVGPDGPVWPDGAAPPIMRTYTPRRFDEQAGTLEVQFVVHGDGPASAWAEQAQVGDRLALAGPGGRFALDPAARRWWIAGDETAIPAIGTLLDALPPSASAEVHVEVADPSDELPLDSAAEVSVTWHHRRQPGAWGEELLDAARDASLTADTHIWVACEATAVRRIRTHLLAERQLAANTVTTRGYWRAGEANHPDHDYGED